MNCNLWKATAAVGVLLVGFAFAGCSRPEQASVSWEERVEAHLSASEGGSLVWDAIEAHGGLEPWLSNGALQFRWKYNMRDRGPDAVVNTLQVVDPDSLQAYHVTPDGSIRFGWDGERYWISPAEANFVPPARFWTHTPFYFIGIPFVFADLNARFQKLDTDFAFEGVDYDQVKVTYTAEAGDAPDDYYILLIHPDTRQVKGARYIVTSPLVSQGGPPVEKLITLDGLSEREGVILPSGHRTFSMSDGDLGSLMRDTDISDVAWLAREAVDFSMPDGAEEL